MADNNATGASEHLYLPPAAPNDNHGHTTASWTLVVLVLIGVVVAAGAVVASLVWLFWVGMGIAAVGVIAGKVLQVLGHGQPTAGERADA
ncbi:HGxxPAAW family protein [Sanguibacter sp. A247]|uniref:HGxxPAAW family protein n=1 Tax=unclassified Sanguibacter TaxID=2645534 RepID=UPI003FD7DE4F